MYFKVAAWDKLVFYVTWITIIPTSIFFFFLFLFLLLQGDSIVIEVCSIFGLIAIFFLIIYTFSPKGYYITPKGIEIVKVLGSIFIPTNQIKHAEIILEASLLRSFGSGGLFGYFGIFYEDNEHQVQIYCTTMKNIIRVKTSETIYYLSPEDSEFFLRKLKELFMIEN